MLALPGQGESGPFLNHFDFDRASECASAGAIGWSFRSTIDRPLVRVSFDSSTGGEAVALSWHADDLPMPTKAKAVVDELEWKAVDR